MIRHDDNAGRMRDIYEIPRPGSLIVAADYTSLDNSTGRILGKGVIYVDNVRVAGGFYMLNVDSTRYPSDYVVELKRGGINGIVAKVSTKNSKSAH